MTRAQDSKMGLRFRVYGLRVRVKGSGFRIQGFWVYGGFRQPEMSWRDWDLGFTISGFGSRGDWGFGFRSWWVNS